MLLADVGVQFKFSARCLDVPVQGGDEHVLLTVEFGDIRPANLHVFG